MVSAASQLKSSLLKAAGAQIYYEVEGSGPVLLMISGGPTDAGIFAALAALLADRYTVVRYDPRGNSRSLLDGPPEDQDMDVHGDDAALLLETLGNGPANVLGSSGGAIIGLNLAARCPQLVKTLVALEPPCVRLLPGEGATFIDDVYETYLAQGAGAAMQKFMEGAGLNGARVERTAPPSAEEVETFARMRGNVDFFLAHGFKPISRYVPDIAALRTGSTAIVVGVGDASAGTLPNRTAAALAERMGTTPVQFPGGHGGYNDDPAGFAEKLHQVLRSA
jgi:pimeloyl-ACP methyl ester carboxylesterase